MLCHHQRFGEKLLIELPRYIGKAISSDVVWYNAKKSLLLVIQMMCRSSKGLELFLGVSQNPRVIFLEFG